MEASERRAMERKRQKRTTEGEVEAGERRAIDRKRHKWNAEGEVEASKRRANEREVTVKCRRNWRLARGGQMREKRTMVEWRGGTGG